MSLVWYLQVCIQQGLNQGGIPDAKVKGHVVAAACRRLADNTGQIPVQYMAHCVGKGGEPELSTCMKIYI